MIMPPSLLPVRAFPYYKLEITSSVLLRAFVKTRLVEPDQYWALASTAPPLVGALNEFQTRVPCSNSPFKLTVLPFYGEYSRAFYLIK